MRSRREILGGMVGTTALLAGCAGILEQSNDGNGDGSSTSDEPSDTGPSPEQQRKDLAAAYRGGVESYNVGSLAYQRATSNYNIELWDMARDAYSESQSDLEEAAQSFDKAGTIAIQLDETTLLDWCDTAQQKAETKRGAAESMIEACDDAAADDLVAADDHVQNANPASQEAEGMTIRDFADVEAALDVDVRDPVTFNP